MTARYYSWRRLAVAVGTDSPMVVARATGMNPRTVEWWRKKDRIHERHIDAVAVAFNRHPFEIWPEAAVDAIADVSRVCANERCRCVFVPHRRDQTYCERACMMRAKARRREARLYRDPEYRAVKIEKNRAYRDWVKARAS